MNGPVQKLVNRREFAAGALACAAAPSAHASRNAILRKTIPSSGETVPAIGMGSWLTFDVGGDDAAIGQRTQVLRAFFDAGGAVIDSSPMYGSSQAVIGEGLRRLGATSAFAADKIWTAGDGAAQLAETTRRWGIERFDLLQVHNLVGLDRQLGMLLDLRAAGGVRHIGVTTYGGLRHEAVEEIIRTRPIDFVQLTCNIFDRTAEQRLLPLAHDRGIAVIANRPFREGALIDHFRGRPLPGVAAEAGAASWPQFLLKFIISHPAITTAIPATRRVDHMRENMAALSGPLPDSGLREEMARAARAA